MLQQDPGITESCTWWVKISATNMTISYHSGVSHGGGVYIFTKAYTIKIKSR